MKHYETPKAELCIVTECDIVSTSLGLYSPFVEAEGGEWEILSLDGVETL